MNKFNGIFLFLATLVVVAAAWVKTDAFLRIRAVEGCMLASSYKYEDKDKGVTTTEPMKDSYEKCMRDKGY